MVRSRGEVGTFSEGLELLPPGIVPAARWRPEEAPDDDAPVSLYGAVGLKR
ncbi:SAM-dependent methyltransferase [Streptomyces sp. NPDC004009]